MKSLIITLLTIGSFSCSHKMLQQSSFESKCYESTRGPLFAANQICFYPGNSFKYTGHGPSTFISSGNWKYNKARNEIELTSNATTSMATTSTNRPDTMWLDLTGKIIKVKNKKQLLFKEVKYKLE